MTTNKCYYMHVIDGHAAFYSPESGQIVYAERRDHWEDDYPLVVVRESVEQIREDQRKTREFRTRMGFSDKSYGKLDFVILSLTPGLIPWKREAVKRSRPAVKRRRRAASK